MACSSGNGYQAQTPTDCFLEQNHSSTKLANSSTMSIHDRLLFHDKLHRLSRCDLETPASIITNVNIKQLLTPAAFDHLPTKFQNELIKLLPETDRIVLGEDKKQHLAMTVNSLSNEFFAKSCVEYRDRLRNGEFCVSSTNSRTDIDAVTWECDSEVLREHPPNLDIPKAGDVFICTSKETSQSRHHKTLKKTRSVETHNAKVVVTKLTKPIVQSSSASSNSNSLLKSSKPLTVSASKTKPISQSAVLAHKAVSKAKAVSVGNLKAKEREVAAHSLLAGVKRPRPEPEPIIKPAVATKIVSKEPSSSSRKLNQTVITKFQKVTESKSSGEKVTKVVPVVVRNPHGQVVTTLANCNPLLTQMIKNPVNSQTTTTGPVKVEKKRSLLPTILKRNQNPVIVTLRNNPNILPSKNGVSKAVNEVISKVRNSASANGNSRPSPVIVTVSSNGSITSKVIPKSVNMERSKQICDSSKQGSQTLDLERSYEICKQVLGKSVEGATIVVIGPGGKRKILSNKPVRNRLLVDAAASANNNSLYSSDIPMYRNKHRGSGKCTLTLSGHVFLALKNDGDGYAAKAYKRKTAFKQKHKKKLSKISGGKKTVKQVCTSSSSSTQVSDSGTTTTTISTGTTSAATDSKSSTSVASSVTAVTDTLYATQPVLSVSENKTNIIKNVVSLLDSCMCSKRALILCRICGAFCHAECTNEDHCLACLMSENEKLQ